MALRICDNDILLKNNKNRDLSFIIKDFFSMKLYAQDAILL